MMDQAQIFLYRVLPWHPIGDPTAFVNVHWNFQGQGYAKPAWSGRACTSIAQCISALQWAQGRSDTKDCYVCMSTQREFEVRQLANGRSMRVALRSQENAVQLRAFWYDLDVKDGHHKGATYTSTKEALAALIDFLKRSGIPRPTLFVETGSGGLHCYWVLDTALSVAEWQPLAQGFANAAHRFNLYADTGCTVDSARIMRMPDTKHSKHGRLATLDTKHMLAYDYTVDEIKTALLPYLGAQLISLTPRGSRDPEAPNVNEAFSAGIEAPPSEPVNLRLVADAGCGFIKEALDTGGRDYAEPLWNLTTMCAVFSTGKRLDAHAMAQGHPEYDVDETNEKYDRKVREHEAKNLGWPSCQAVANAGCDHCGTCTLRGPNTKPLQFGWSPLPAQPPPNPSGTTTGGTEERPLLALPGGYYYKDGGQVWKGKKGEAGGRHDFCVSPYWIGDPWLQDDPWTLHTMVKVHPDGRIDKLSVRTGQFHTTDFGKIVGDAGLSLEPKQLKELRMLFTSWQQQLRNDKEAVASAQPFGWSTNSLNVNDGFCYGGIRFTANGQKPTGRAPTAIASDYMPRGELKPWIEAAKLITDLQQPQRDVFLAASFAAPLVKWLGQSGCILAGYGSGSGFGKTTTLRIGLSVWAHPKRALNGTTDTINGAIGKMGVLQALPIFWDEIKTAEQGQKFNALVFDITKGNEKARMTSDAKLAPMGSWDTLLVSANNTSMVEEITRQNKTTTAGIYRLFEFVLPKLTTTVSGTMADQMVLRLENNYGQAGLIYAKFLGENVDKVHEEIVALRAELEDELHVQNDERLWLCTMATLVLGAQYANDLGLTSFNVGQLRSFLRDCFLALRREAQKSPVDMENTESLANTLSSYTSAMRAYNTLKTDRMHVGRGRPPVNNPIQILSKMDDHRDIRIHIASATQIMRIDATHFRDWMQKNGYSTHNVVNAMKSKWFVKDVSAILGAGTDYKSGVMSLLFELDLTHPDLQQFVDL